MTDLAMPRAAIDYNDDVVKKFIIAAVFWAIIAFTVGCYLATELSWPVFNLGLPWLNFGRLRPVHTSAAIFAFGGSALLGTSFFVVQRTCRARLWGGPALANFIFWGYQFFIVMAALSYVMGFSKGREYAEPEWHIDLWLTIVWVLYAAVFVGTLVRRSEPHIYVANWFYLSFILTVAVLHIVNNLTWPISVYSAKSYSFFAGVQDALIQWWYGHNAVGFFLTAGFLGMMYYFIPKAANRPVYSYRLSIVHFWSLIFIYIWAGPHHLLWTSLPDWTQTLGVVFSIMLWMPSWGGHDQRPHDPLRRLGQAAHRSRPALLRHRRGVLRHVHLRRSGHVDARCQCAQPLHGLGHRPCAFGLAGLGGLHQLWRNVLSGAEIMAQARPIFRQAGLISLLDQHDRHCLLHRRHVGGGDYGRADVAGL
jgi:cbb3-type cytochrome oxidase subunit 1